MESAPTITGIRALTDVVRDQGADLVVAVGGGSVMDSAKMAALAVRQPSILCDGWEDPGGLLVPTLRASRRALPCIAAPATIGTGSEVSPSASVRTADTKKLLVHAGLRPTVAVLDPAATATTPRSLIVEGALEILLRAIGPLVGESDAEPFSDGVAAAVARQVIHDGGVASTRQGASDGEEIAARHRLALASAHTHTGWLLAGRDSFGHKLWYLANETAVALGVTKMQATAALLPAYLHYLGRGRFPGTSPLRLEQMARLLVRGGTGSPDGRRPAAGPMEPAPFARRDRRPSGHGRRPGSLHLPGVGTAASKPARFRSGPARRVLLRGDGSDPDHSSSGVPTNHQAIEGGEDMNDQLHGELDLDLGIEDLESLEAPDFWGDFWAGVAIGVGLVALGAAVT